MALSRPDRIAQIADEWRPILDPVLHLKPGRGAEAALQVSQNALDDDHVMTLAGYVNCMYFWPDCRPVAEFIVEYHKRLPDSQKDMFKWVCLGPLCGYASCNVRQSALLYNLVKLGWTSYEEVRPYIREEEPWWFWIECGKIQDPAEIAKYHQRRNEYQGFTAVHDAIIRDDVQKLSELTSIEAYQVEAAVLPRAQEGQPDPYDEINIKNWEDIYPIGLGALEDQYYTFLEFSLRWCATQCFNMLLSRGAKVTPRCLWAAIQGGDIEMLRQVETKLGELGTQPDDFTVGCAINFAIRLFRVDQLDWLLRTYTRTVEAVTPQIMSVWLDTAAMSNNPFAWSLVYQYVPATQQLPCTWLMAQFPLYHGNMQVLLAMFPSGPEGPALTEREEERDNYLRWTMRSMRVECVKWLIEKAPAVCAKQWKYIKNEEFMQNWIRLRPEQGELVNALPEP